MKTKNLLFSCFLTGILGFTQTMNAQTNLDVNNINAKTGHFSDMLNAYNLAIHPAKDGSGSHIYTYHKLTIGAIGYAHNDIEIKSAGGTQGPTYTSLSLFRTPTPNKSEKVIQFYTGPNSKSYINSGYLGINTTNPIYELDVNGTIRAKEIRVETGWADFVFDKDYKLPTLEEVKAHIEEHKHLPGIPSEKEVKENGVGLADMTTKLLQKVEELTLYSIQQQEMIQTLSKKIEELENDGE